jgi:hypothetical protein
VEITEVTDEAEVPTEVSEVRRTSFTPLDDTGPVLRRTVRLPKPDARPEGMDIVTLWTNYKVRVEDVVEMWIKCEVTLSEIITLINRKLIMVEEIEEVTLLEKLVRAGYIRTSKATKCRVINYTIGISSPFGCRYLVTSFTAF